MRIMNPNKKKKTGKRFAVDSVLVADIAVDSVFVADLTVVVITLSGTFHPEIH